MSHTNEAQEGPVELPNGSHSQKEEFDEEQYSPVEIPTPSEDESDGEEESREEMTEEEIQDWLTARYRRGRENPMKEPLTAPWGLPVSDTDMEKLRIGFKSRSMDDKWDILVEDPDENGIVSAHIIRNWLRNDCYILHAVPNPADNTGGSAIIQGITWEGNMNGWRCEVEQAKKEAVIICRNFLEADFETLPDYSNIAMRDPKAYTKVGTE